MSNNASHTHENVLNDVQSEYYKKVHKIYRTILILCILPLLTIALWIFFYADPHLMKIEKSAIERKNYTQDFLNKIDKIDNMSKKGIGGVTVLTKDEIDSIKKTLFYLKEEIDKAIDKSHFETSNIVDRINVYITIGIVLLTLMGVFVPVFVQNFGREEMKEIRTNVVWKVKSLDTKISEQTEKIEGFIEEQIDKIKTGSQKKLEEVNSRINEVGSLVGRESKRIKKINKEIVNIPPLRLSFSLMRALDKDFIRWYIKEPSDSQKYLSSVFNDINKDLSDCKESMTFETNNKILKKSLENFSSHLDTLLHTYQSKRSNLRYFEELQSHISAFVENQIQEKEESYFDNVIDSVKSVIESMGGEVTENRREIR